MQNIKQQTGGFFSNGGWKSLLHRIFVTDMGKMTQGFFATLIVGTMLKTFGTLIGSAAGGSGIFYSLGILMILFGAAASSLTGAGIGVAVANKPGTSQLVIISAGVCGMIGAYATKILDGTLTAAPVEIIDGRAINAAAVSLPGAGDSVGAFVAALVGIAIGNLVAGKTKIDIVVTPLCTIAAGAAMGLIAGPPLSAMMTSLGDFIKWAMIQQPFIMSVIVSVVVGAILTSPVSSTAICLMIGISGLSAGAATVGCCCHMVGYATISARDNGPGGVLAQGVGTAMLQLPNLTKKPILWLPPIIASAILGPIGTLVFGMQNSPMGAGMGSSGFVGQIETLITMTGLGEVWFSVLLKMLVIYYLLPAAVTFAAAWLMRKRGLIEDGDMKIAVNK